MADVTMPFDLEVQNQQLQQKRALQQALAQRAMTQPQGQMVSGHYVGPGIGGVLSTLGDAALSKVVGDQADVAQNNYANMYQQQLSAGLNSYLDNRDGKAGGTMNDAQASALMNNDQAPSQASLADPIAANPRKAIVEAMGSRIPELQAIGKADMANYNKAQQPELMQMQNGDLVSATASTGQVRTLGRFGKPEVVNGQVFRPDGTRIVDGRDKYGPVQALAKPEGGLPVYGALDETGKPTFSPSPNADPAMQGNRDSLAAVGKTLGSARDTVMQSTNDLRNAQQLMNLASDPQIIAGAGAGPQTTLAGIGAKLGLTGPDAATKTQVMLGLMAKGTLAASQHLGGPKSDADILFLNAASDGKQEWTPQALQHLAGLTIAANHNATLNAVQQYNGAASVNGADEIAKQYPLPPFKYTLDPGQFPETVNGRVQYQGPLMQQPTAPTPTAPVVRNWH